MSTIRSIVYTDTLLVFFLSVCRLVVFSMCLFPFFLLNLVNLRMPCMLLVCCMSSFLHLLFNVLLYIVFRVFNSLNVLGFRFSTGVCHDGYCHGLMYSYFTFLGHVFFSKNNVSYGSCHSDGFYCLDFNLVVQFLVTDYFNTEIVKAYSLLNDYPYISSLRLIDFLTMRLL